MALQQMGPDADEAVPALVRMLRDKDLGPNAVNALAATGTGAAPALEASLHAPDSETQKNAAAALVALDNTGADDQALKVLLAALGGSDGGARNAVIFALARSRRAVPALITLLGRQPCGSPSEAAAALAQIGEPAVPDVLKALRSDDDNVREDAASVFGQMWQVPDAAVEPLLIALRDRNEHVREEAARGLDNTGPVGDVAVPDLLQVLKNTGEKRFVREAAAKALGHRGPTAIAPLTELLGSEDETSRALAVTALTGLGENLHRRTAAQVVRDVVPKLTGENRQERTGAVAVLQNISDDPDARSALLDHVPILEQALHSSEVRVRVAAAVLFGQMPLPKKEAVTALTLALNDSDEEVRLRAAIALAYHGGSDEKLLPFLIQALQSSDEHLRWQAAERLREFKSADARRALAAYRHEEAARREHHR
jgi:HEAT repeat protein